LPYFVAFLENKMAIIYPHFLNSVLNVHNNANAKLSYPFFDPACCRYEAIRSTWLDEATTDTVLRKYGLTEYAYRQSLNAFKTAGVIGLIGLDSKRITEPLPIEIERMILVLKKARPWIPATKMVLILKGFDKNISLVKMRHFYASYGWALGTKPYKAVDFNALNLRVIRLSQLKNNRLERKTFFNDRDRTQNLIEVFRTLEVRGVTRRYNGSRVSFEHHKKNFLSLGLLGLVEKARPQFRNSKLGFKEEGTIIISKIQKPQKDEEFYLNILKSKSIKIDQTCLTKIFSKWKVKDFKSKYKGDLDRLQQPESKRDEALPPFLHPDASSSESPVRLDLNFISLVNKLKDQPIRLANPGIFLFLPYLNRLKIFEKGTSMMNLDPDRSYSWFSLLLLDLGRIWAGHSSISKACQTYELSLPLLSGLVNMPTKTSLLEGLADINEDQLLQLRRYLTQASRQHQLIQSKRIALDFKMRDFTNDDVELKNIGKGPSPKRHICFPGFRPHLAWDIETGAPITIEFRNGKARATTTIERFVRELLLQAFGSLDVDHVYLDSEYTAQHVWKYIADPDQGLGADLTMCVKQNKKVKKFIDSFLENNPIWLFYDEDHTYSKGTFAIPIPQTEKIIHCVLKRQESNGRMRCFGSTMKGLDAKGILKEYTSRWKIENGIKDLVQNYFFDNIPGIDPHRINIHYFIVTLARILFEMLCRDYDDAKNPDLSQKTIGTLRPEFINGVNAVLTRVDDQLILSWKDAYPENKHRPIETLFAKLNQNSHVALPFLGGLKLRFEISPARTKNFDLYG